MSKWFPVVSKTFEKRFCSLSRSGFVQGKYAVGCYLEEEIQLMEIRIKQGGWK